MYQSNFHRFHADKTPLYLMRKLIDDKNLEVLSGPSRQLTADKYWLFPISFLGREQDFDRSINIPHGLHMVKLKRIQGCFFIAAEKDAKNIYNDVIDAYHAFRALPPMSLVPSLLSDPAILANPRFQLLASEMAKVARSYARTLDTCASRLATLSGKTCFSAAHSESHFYHGPWLLDGDIFYPVFANFALQPDTVVSLKKMPTEHFVFRRMYAGLRLSTNAQLNISGPDICEELVKRYLFSNQVPPQYLLIFLANFIGTDESRPIDPGYQAVIRQGAKVNRLLAESLEAIDPKKKSSTVFKPLKSPFVLEA